jgi:hypothetical protein
MTKRSPSRAGGVRQGLAHRDERPLLFCSDLFNFGATEKPEIQLEIGVRPGFFVEANAFSLQWAKAPRLHGPRTFPALSDPLQRRCPGHPRMENQRRYVLDLLRLHCAI